MNRFASTAGWSLSPVLIAGCFFVALLPMLVDQLLFHPDERHYVDGALQMLATGDWLTPSTADGAVRLQKPVLAYWFAAAGAKVLSPSPFSIRLLFLLAGAGTIWFGARTAGVISGSRTAAALTALLLASHPAIILSSTRSLPDAVLGLSIAVSLSGFSALIVRGRADWGPLLTAYLGGALAVLSKGSPAIVFLVYATGYLSCLHSTLFRAQWRRFVLAITACVLCGGSWFLVMYSRHGAELPQQFLSDQSAPYRFASEAGQIGLQLLAAAALLAFSFGLSLFPALRTIGLRRHDALQFAWRLPHRFLLGWIGLFLLCAACINHINLRYLLPAAIPLAILLGILLNELDGPALRRNMRITAWLMALVCVLLALGLAVTQAATAPLAGAMSLVVAVGCATAFRHQLRFTSVIRSLTVSAGALLASVWLAIVVWLVHSPGSFGYQMSAALRQQTAGEQPLRLTLIGEPAHASRVRICSGGMIDVDFRPIASGTLLSLQAPVATLDSRQVDVQVPSATVVAIPCGLDSITPAEAWTAFRSGQLVEFVRSRQRFYKLLLPRNALDAAATQVADHESDVRRQL
jgi:4-amino-4-deoxy-L-arabinose transferase-like glycosyltransferase